MRVLLDANIPQDFRHELREHEVETARFAGLNDLDDGALLERMSGRFDVLVTMDTSLDHQQNIAEYPFAVIVLRARSNRLSDLLPLVAPLLEVLKSVSPGEVREVA